MTFCKSFSCRLISLPFRHETGFITDFGDSKKLLNVKCLFQTRARTFMIKKNNDKSSTKGSTVKNVLPAQEHGGHPITLTRLWKSFTFTAAFSAGTYALCAIWQYENSRKRNQSLMESSTRKIWTNWHTKKHFSWREELNKQWNKLTHAEKLFSVLCFTNILVYLAWKRPKFESTMIKYFSSNPSSGAVCWPLLFSTFSHYSIVHLALNMFILYSFSDVAMFDLGIEQFLALYLTGGVFSSYVSLFFRALRQRPMSSLGASGAIFTLIGYVSVKYPDLRVSVIFLPMYTFSALTALKAICLLDFVGLVLGWRALDHAAHLGGVIFGIFWCNSGKSLIWEKKDSFIRWWDELRRAE
ncbi:UNVERIFIED_CONTAM: hypothetical protein PYX00_002574 [Menopon gallinae]|uniref:rhomboid protease n=1 Tax=Menopon gallinae TaxID=328185 RepID=A0AAW2IH43_9NEOP